MPSSPLSGGCGCGAVRFHLDAPPTRAAYCHCTRCQRRTGTAAAATALIVPGSLTIESGEDEIRGWDPGGGGFVKCFCGRCGSALFVKDPQTGAWRGVRLGAFYGDPGVRPSLRQHLASAAVWEPVPDDGLPRHEGAAPRPPQ